jgi:hypothetical protein
MRRGPVHVLRRLGGRPSKRRLNKIQEQVRINEALRRKAEGKNNEKDK